MILKFKTLKSVTKSTLTVYKTKFLSLKRPFSRKVLKSNNSLSKRHPSDKCLTPKPTDINNKFKLFNKDSNRMNSTLMKNTPNLNKK